jgi:hypothetical protein
MKSRLMVSLLFTLVAASFLPNATIAVEKLRSRTDKILGCTAAHITGRVAHGEKGNGMTVRQAFSPTDASRQLDSLRAAGSQEKDLEFLTSASRIREILDVMQIK